MTINDRWTAHGVNQLLHFPYAVVPAPVAPAVQRIADDELGIRTVVAPAHRIRERRVVRVER